jgi:uncharacterized membrane protein
MDKWFYRASLALVIIGLVVSIYMTIFKRTNNSAMCLGSHACGDVVMSRYSDINGISVPEIGVTGFAALLIVLFFEPRIPFLRRNGTLVIFGMALMGFLVVLWLIYVEVALLKAYCPFCITTQISMILVFTLAVIRLIRQPLS